MARLHNKTAIITGGTGGIGLATARLFLREQARVMLVDRDEETLRRAVEELGHGYDRLDYATADVRDAAQVSAFVEKTQHRFGKIDIVFCNAGVGGEPYLCWECPEEEYDRVMDINVKGTWLTMKYAIPVMMAGGGGSIIITSSVAGLCGLVRGFEYSASKHAVIGLAKSAAIECARMNIRVNTIHPGPIETPMVRLLEKGIRPEDAQKAKLTLEKAIPMGRYGVPEEVGQLVVFLASDESSFITGSEYRIDGGLRSV